MKKIFLALVMLLSALAPAAADIIESNLGLELDVCAYTKHLECEFKALNPADPNSEHICAAKDYIHTACEHPYNPFLSINSCFFNHPSKICNIKATSAEQCVLLDEDAKCFPASRRDLKTEPTKKEIRHCECLCKKADGEILIGADSQQFSQEEPFSQSCQQEFISYLPPDDNGQKPELKYCEGYTEESYAEYMESFFPGEELDPRGLEHYLEEGTMQCNLFDPEQRKKEVLENP